MKVCARCGAEKSAEHFSRNPKRKDGLRSYCKQCDREYRRGYYQRNRDGELRRTGAWAKANPESGRASTKRWREANREVIRERKRAEYAVDGQRIAADLRDRGFRRKYGISVAERDAMAAAQEQRCAICRRHEREFDRRLAVDHDHETGAVRRLLCEPCNTGLGKFMDDPDVLERAAEYLRTHKAGRAGVA